MVSPLDWAPDRGDFVWMNFSPRVGHEQSGYRPALTLTPLSFNRRMGFGLFCPVRSRVKGYLFEVPIPAGSKIEGAVLTEQVKSVDWRERKAKPAGRAPDSVVQEALAKVRTLLA